MSTESTLISFDSLWNAHPDIADGEHLPCQYKDGSFRFANQCAIRMGITLKRCGIEVPNAPKWDKYLRHCKWHKGEQHVMGAEPLARWIQKYQRKTFGAPKKSKGADWDTTHGVTSLSYPKPGLVFFKDFWGRIRPGGKKEKPKRFTGDHIDVWSGTEQAGGGSNAWFQMSKQIWYWELPVGGTSA